MKGKSEGFVREVALEDRAATEAMGAQIAAVLTAGDVLALSGDLGAGKTTFARAVLRALGVAEHVPSPTFTLVQHYETPQLSIHHFDLYRVKDELEMEQLGLEDALYVGAALIEWPDRAGSRLSTDALHIDLEITGEHSRRAVLSGPAEWALRLFESANS